MVLKARPRTVQQLCPSIGVVSSKANPSEKTLSLLRILLRCLGVDTQIRKTKGLGGKKVRDEKLPKLQREGEGWRDAHSAALLGSEHDLTASRGHVRERQPQ